jgi:hypothetical protein
MNKRLKTVFILQLVLIFVVLILLFTELNEFLPMAPMIVFILFSTIGLIFTLLVKRNLQKGKLKTILLINGLSAFGLMLFAILHNLMYALAEMVSNGVITTLLEFMSGTFFIIGVIGCPVVFLVSSVLAAMQFKKVKDK